MGLATHTNPFSLKNWCVANASAFRTLATCNVDSSKLSIFWSCYHIHHWSLPQMDVVDQKVRLSVPQRASSLRNPNYESLLQLKKVRGKYIQHQMCQSQVVSELWTVNTLGSVSSSVQEKLQHHFLQSAQCHQATHPRKLTPHGNKDLAKRLKASKENFCTKHGTKNT